MHTIEYEYESSLNQTPLFRLCFRSEGNRVLPNSPPAFSTRSGDSCTTVGSTSRLRCVSIVTANSGGVVGSILLLQAALVRVKRQELTGPSTELTVNPAGMIMLSCCTRPCEMRNFKRCLPSITLGPSVYRPEPFTKTCVSSVVKSRVCGRKMILAGQEPRSSFTRAADEPDFDSSATDSILAAESQMTSQFASS